MKLKHKISLLVIGILLVVSLLISSSYALWVFNVSQESTNVVKSDCFEITLTDNNPISLGASFPMRDSDGVQTTPYTFTIKNICNHPADFQINLETLSSSTIDESFIKADLNGHITEYNTADSVEPTISGARSAAMLYEDTLAVNSSKTYNLRIWVNETATQDDVENKTYASKVSVRTTVRKQYAEGTLISGTSFNVALKTLAGDTNPKYSTANTSITSIEWSENAPLESDNAINIAVEGTTTPIYAWFNNGIIYINSELDKIYMNPASSDMFYNFQSVTSLDLSHFDTSKVTNMSFLFREMKSITSLDMSHFDTSKVKNMSAMFYKMVNVTNLDVSHFDTSNVTNMYGMFCNMANVTNLDVSHFDTSNVTNMSSMFDGMSSITSLDVSHFNTTNVTNMSSMFREMSGLTSLDVSHFSTSNVTDMKSMFNGMSNLTNLDLSSFDTSNVTNMESMFFKMSSLTSLDVSNFDTSNVTNMYDMFSAGTGSASNCYSSLKSIDGLKSFNTSKVTNMSYMFMGACALTELDLSSFDTSNTVNMKSMFDHALSVNKIYVGNNWSSTQSDTMFANCYNIVGGSGTTYNSKHVGAEYARVDDPENGKPGYFTLKTN